MVDRAMVHIGSGMQTSSWSPFHSLGHMRSIAIQETHGAQLEIIEDNSLYHGNLSYNTRVNKSIVVFQDAGERRRLIGLLGSHVDDDIVTGTQAFKDQVIHGVPNEVYRYKWVSHDFEKNHKTTAVLTFTGIQIRRSEKAAFCSTRGPTSLVCQLCRCRWLDVKTWTQSSRRTSSTLCAAVWLRRHG